MANVNAPDGLTPLKHRNGAPYNGGVNPYYIRSDYATALYVGDPVIRTSDGGNAAKATFPGVGSFEIGTIPTINKATAGDGNLITGVIVAFAANADNLTQQYSPASTEGIAFVCDDPDVIFTVQDDGSAVLAATNVSNNANLVFTHAGSTVTGRSGVELDATTPSADQSNQLTIQRGVNAADNDCTAINARWEVKINQHTEANNTLGY